MKKLFLFLICFIPISVLADEGTNVGTGAVVTPIGTIEVYAGIESDTQLLERGYLIADGSSLLRTEYPDLYATIGTTYGSVDSTHFNLPNLKGKTVVGMDSSDNDFKNLGQTGGAKTVTLTTNQIPSHTHTFTGTSVTTSTESVSHTHTFNGTTSSDGTHAHGYTIIPMNFGKYGQSSGEQIIKYLHNNETMAYDTYNTANAGAHSHTFSGTTTAASTTHTHTLTAAGTNANTGGGSAHNNLQPYIALKYIIKVK